MQKVPNNDKIWLHSGFSKCITGQNKYIGRLTNMICKHCGNQTSDIKPTCSCCGRSVHGSSAKPTTITNTQTPPPLNAGKQISLLEDEIKRAQKNKKRSIIDICYQIALFLIFRLDVFDRSFIDVLDTSSGIESAFEVVLGLLHDYYFIVAIIMICCDFYSIYKSNANVEDCISKIASLRETSSPGTAQSPSGINGWKCTCGKINADYVSSCVCGKRKKDVKTANSNKQI